MQQQYILNIDTSNRQKVVVSLNIGKKEIAKLERKNTFSSQALLPAIIHILKKSSIGWKDLKEIKVKQGPGSYTGLRIGVSVAKVMAWILEIPLNNKNPEKVNPFYNDL